MLRKGTYGHLQNIASEQSSRAGSSKPSQYFRTPSERKQVPRPAVLKSSLPCYTISLNYKVRPIQERSNCITKSH